MIKTEKRHLLKSLIAIPLCLLLYCYNLMPGANAGGSLVETFAKTVFGVMNFEYTYVYAMTVENIAFILL